MLADLPDQRQRHAHAEAEPDRREPGARALSAVEGGEVGEAARLAHQHHHERQHQARDPQRLRPRLHLRDRAHAVRGKGQHDQRREQVADRQRDAERQLEGLAHDRAFEREEDDREAGVDQRRERRPEVAEAGSAG
ncbi:hypothetical protein AB0F91_01015 [Amycolatopsis sp. NPDC023774]|uniref:hypothetical protein n=1 Tax=Amycolatopsis sp. NPDC023774 TaxID=3155015 RepID=UPI0033C1A129